VGNGRLRQAETCRGFGLVQQYALAVTLTCDKSDMLQHTTGSHKRGRATRMPFRVAPMLAQCTLDAAGRAPPEDFAKRCGYDAHPSLWALYHPIHTIPMSSSPLSRLCAPLPLCLLQYCDRVEAWAGICFVVANPNPTLAVRYIPTTLFLRHLLRTYSSAGLLSLGLLGFYWSV
jgi:hypothetical protein